MRIPRRSLLGTAAAAAGALAAGLAGPAWPQPGPPHRPPQAPPPSPPSGVQPGGPGPQHPEPAAEHRLLAAEHMVDRVIAFLEHDPQDYAGYKTAAIQALRQARQDLEQAIQVARQTNRWPLPSR
jgi:hypothetical protein